MVVVDISLKDTSGIELIKIMIIGLPLVLILLICLHLLGISKKENIKGGQ